MSLFTSKKKSFMDHVKSSAVKSAKMAGNVAGTVIEASARGNRRNVALDSIQQSIEMMNNRNSMAAFSEEDVVKLELINEQLHQLFTK